MYIYKQKRMKKCIDTRVYMYVYYYERKLVLAGAFGQILDGEDKICIYAYDIINIKPWTIVPTFHQNHLESTN